MELISLSECRPGMPHTFFKNLLEGRLVFRVLFDHALPSVDDEEAQYKQALGGRRARGRRAINYYNDALSHIRHIHILGAFVECMGQWAESEGEPNLQGRIPRRLGGRGCESGFGS